MATYFTSDTHYHHVRIVEYCQRPFVSVEEMNEELIRRHNEVVSPSDHVYHLGDFCLGPAARAPEIRARLSGHLVLVLGNHDRSARAMRAAGFEAVHHALTLDVGDVRVALSHRPPRTDAWRATGAGYALHGHVHGAYARRGDLVNVGVDVRGFRPVTLAELLEGMDG